MRLTYNVTGAQRKSLAGAISQELNAPTKYLGTPTFTYEVGNYQIDKVGTLTGPDNLDLEADLHGLYGFEAVQREYDEPDTYESGLGGMGALDEIPDIDQHHPGQYANPDAPITDTMQSQLDEVSAFEDLRMDCREELGLGRTRREDPQGEIGMRSDDCPEYQAELKENGLYETFAIEIPKNGLADEQIQNILKLVESKRTLLTKALGRPLTVNDTGETLKFLYPYSEEAGLGTIYSQLSTAIFNHAKKRQRVTAVEREVESEKFAMRTFLVRLGMNGGEFSAARKWLCRNLSGNASFANDTSYASMQASRRNGGQADEQE